MTINNFNPVDGIEVIVPIVTFILGWGSGVISAAILYRDHEKRISHLEDWQEHHIAEYVEGKADLDKLYTTLRVKGTIE